MSIQRSGGKDSHTADSFHSTPGEFTYAASRTLNVSASSNWKLTDALTGNIAITLSNGEDGDSGVIDMVQDGSGNHLITSFTASGRTVLMDDGLSSINTDAMRVASKRFRISYEFVTVNSVPILWVNILSGAAIGYA